MRQGTATESAPKEFPHYVEGYYAAFFYAGGNQAGSRPRADESRDDLGMKCAPAVNTAVCASARECSLSIRRPCQESGLRQHRLFGPCANRSRFSSGQLGA